jgi:hypothetical protein
MDTLQTAITAAQSAESDSYLSQAEVNSAYSTLNAALTAFYAAKIQVSFTALDAAIGGGKAITNNNYEAALWNALQTAITNGEAVRGTQYVTQAAADAAAQAINDAIAALRQNTVSHTITATAGAGGSISPSGAVSVTSGASQTFTITPNAYYSVSAVLVDGVSVGAVSTYTFSNVTTNRTIEASFTYTGGGYTGGNNGGYYTNASVTPTSATFDKNGGASVTVTFSSGSYSIRSVKNGNYTLVKDKDYTVSGGKLTLTV